MGRESRAPKNKFSPSKIPMRNCTGLKRLPPRFSIKPHPRAVIGKPVKPGSTLRTSSDEKWLDAVKEKSVSNRQHAWKESGDNSGWSNRSALSYNDTEEKGNDNDACASTRISTKQNGTNDEPKVSSKLALKFERSLPNHLAASPTWRGKFTITSNISSCEYYNDIVAHPPSKVHRKVYELSKQLPESLRFELLPRLSLWTELFDDDDVAGPVDIGLYFLPLKSCEEKYFSLVEHLNKGDMLLKSSINGVELLIFSSNNLKDGSKEIDGRHFLWGVLRAHTTNALPDNRPSQMEQDMEVDMIGGHEMGNVVPKPPPFVRDKTVISSPALCSLIKREMSFERELQRCFDIFEAAYSKEKGKQGVKL